jgi:diaminopimelate epimerase
VALDGWRESAGTRFVKGHGTGNDFVLLPDPDGDLDLTPAMVRALCDRRRGVGGDGVLRVVLAAAAGEPLAPADRDADAGVSAVVGPPRWFMDYRNADGSLSEMCGNGIRVFARYLVDAGCALPGTLAVATRGGVKVVDVPATGDVTVDMGPPRIVDGPGTPVTLGERSWDATAVSMGNPHAVCFLSDATDAASGATSGPAGTFDDAPADAVAEDLLGGLDLSRAPLVDPDAFPAGVNVEFVAGSGRSIMMRVHERGAGETASCGTGACAAAVAHAVRSGVKPADGAPVDIKVAVPGGELHVTWTPATVLLRGPAVLVSDGVLREGWDAPWR